jgi:hypothetical protein
MIDYQSFGDLEAMVSQVIRETVEGVAGVFSSIPSAPSFPLFTVQRVGGQPAVAQHLDNARIQIDVWGTSKSEARDLADVARVAIHQAEGRTFETGSGSDDVVDGYITAVRDVLWLNWLPDPLTGRDRYFFVVSVYGR